MNQSRPHLKQILFLVSSMQGGGAERVAASLCNYWVEKGHKVTLMPTFSGRGSCDYALDEKVHLDFLADHLISTPENPWNKVLRLQALRRVIKNTAPNVVISFLTRVNVAALLASHGLPGKVIVSERNFPPLCNTGFGTSWSRKLTYHWSDEVVAMTSETASWLADHVPMIKPTVIPNPVVLPLKENEPYLDPGRWVQIGRRMLLAAGRLVEQKGFDLLIPAFAKIARDFPAWDLVILGEGPQRASLVAQRDGLGLKSRIHLPGFAGNVRQWYQRADVYVLSSRYEGFGNTLLEALAHGLPAVSFDCDAGPRDMIRPDLDGLLVPPEQGTIGLARALERLMGDETLRTKMGQSALQARDRFSMEVISKRWDELL